MGETEGNRAKRRRAREREAGKALTSAFLAVLAALRAVLSYRRHV